MDQATEFIRTHLQPPILDLTVALPRPTAPDVIVRRQDDALEVEVVPGPWSTVEVSSAYRQLVALGSDQTAAVRQQVHDAAQLVDLVARRERTLLRLAQYVVQHQRTRVLNGRAAHVPLTRRDAAAHLRVHESTISRTVRDKLVQLPCGQIISLADLFGSSTGAVEALRELLRLPGRRSDRELAKLLADRGFPVARRTVTKYRAMLGVPTPSDPGSESRFA